MLACNEFRRGSAMNDADWLEEAFQAARTGKGSRPLSLSEAREFLRYCTDRRFAFQTVEASELVDGLEYPRIDCSVLGLTNVEKSAQSLDDLASIARSRLEMAASAPNDFVFQIWIDTAESLLGKKHN